MNEIPGKEHKMAKKYYAVRNGYHIGIFETWEECKREVDGFSGAEFKSFPDRRGAEEFLGAIRTGEQLSLDRAVAYVDGSYNIETTCYGCGVVLLIGGEEIEISRAFDDPEMALMRNVAGEIEGALIAMRYCVENDIGEIDLYYDYAGIEKWCTGEWKTNKEGTTAYKRSYDEISKTVRINFIKVKSHSGDEYNDKADRLAKNAVGVE